jgi:hypothetical protein
MIVLFVNITLLFLIIFNAQHVECDYGWSSPPSKKVIVLKEPPKKCVPKVIVVPKIKYVKVPGPKPPQKIIVVKGPPKKPKIIVVKEPAPSPPPGKTILVKQPPAAPPTPQVILVKQKVPFPVKSTADKSQVIVVEADRTHDWK